MSTNRPEKFYRLFYASNPSGAFCASLCAAQVPREGAIDVLMLQSDFYGGANLREYETVMEALAGGYDWTQVGFCNGVSSTLVYVGRKEAPKSWWQRTYSDIKDGKFVDRCVKNLFIAADPTLANRRQIIIDEIWADTPVLPPRFLYAKYKRAKKVLYPHTPVILWGDDTTYFRLLKGGNFKPPYEFLGKTARKALAATLPLGLAIHFSEWVFDTAYTLRDKEYLAHEVINLERQLTKESLQKAFRRLPKDAQEYYTGMSLPDEEGNRPSILFLSTGGERPQDYEKELAAFNHLLKATADVRGNGPVILKPHPRGREDYFQRISQDLQQQSPKEKFRVIDKWTSVPIEIAASTWNITCGLGLFTDALFSIKMLLNVPAYCPAELLYKMYADDPLWKLEWERVIRTGDGHILFI